MNLTPIQQMEQRSSGIQMLRGQPARDKLERLLARTFDEDATGGAYAYRWEARLVEGRGKSLAPVLTELDQPAFDQSRRASPSL